MSKFPSHLCLRGDKGIVWHINMGKVVRTLFNSGKFAKQIATLLPIVVKSFFDLRTDGKAFLFFLINQGYWFIGRCGLFWSDRTWIRKQCSTDGDNSHIWQGDQGVHCQHTKCTGTEILDHQWCLPCPSCHCLLSALYWWCQSR